MDHDLSFIQYQHHTKLIEEIIDEFSNKAEVIGILLIGSVARGDAYENSDLDLCILIEGEMKKKFICEERLDTVVEFKYATLNQIKLNLERNHMELYSFLDGKIMLDRQGTLENLIDIAQEKYASYRASRKKKDSISHWLTSSFIKINNAINTKDLKKAMFIVNTTTWTIYEGLWAVNDKPIPPVGAICFYFKELDQLPNNINSLTNQMLLGDVNERIDSTKELIKWIQSNIYSRY
ncbi:nucleotidyltransferase family protein [Alkalicoccobacillus gibsonii]|uniref:nucleotidyltransferase family protein n=1 Tax=Alkalicoccobacillus gibsonii TaxID=79881 RepID=UPI0019344D05|nr:nucleotidyltransferase domain-containing protein [Alkalicoccobacillus gibsonii]MBM0066783.1 nucleotidyltransferase domain-containing protein [Alkalicoccobacillus gibsonii]